jgi:class 3 adenylate cyclase
MQTDSEHFDQFVSRFLRDSLTRWTNRFEEPFGEIVSAALMFGDLSGFTQLTEQLAHDNRRGAEHTQRILNEHFCRILETIERWGGAVLKFAGDATIALWPAEPHGLAQATLAATRCALDIQASLHRVASPELRVMSHRVVIGGGSIWLAHVGGVDDKWEFVVGGEPWDQIRRADERAEIGSVVLSPQAWSHVKAHARGRHAGEGCYIVTRCNDQVGPNAPAHVSTLSSASGEPSVAPYLSRKLRAQLVAAQRDWLAEHRWLTVLYLKLDDPPGGSPAGLGELHRVTRNIQQRVDEYEGHIVQHLIDDKGFVTVIAWGLSFNAHEDDSERALRAARSLREDLDTLGLRSSMAITSGNVFAGLLGHFQHLEYAIIGDPVNTAGRIAALQTHDFRCDRATRVAAERRFAFELADAVQLKGKAEAIELYRVEFERSRRDSARPLAHRPLPAMQRLVDRSRERDIIEQRLDGLGSGAGLFLHVVGDPGVGKTAFLEFALAAARMRGFTCAFGSGDSLRRNDVYIPWSAVLPTLLGARDLVTADDIRIALDALDLRDSLAPLLNPLLPHELPETPQTRNLDAAGRADLTRELIADIALAAQSKARLLVVLDDAHWFDSASWSLLVTLLRRVPTLPLVLSSRPLAASLPSDARRVLEWPSVERLDLGPLSFQDSRELISARLGASLVSDDLAQRVFSQAEGHPLFTEELLLSLQQQNAIRRVEQAAALTGDTTRPQRIVLPEGLDAVVASRIAGLDPAQQLTLKVASVIGRRFELQALCALHPHPLARSELQTQLEVMCNARLLEHAANSESDSYRFHHSIIQNVVHDLMVSEQQRQLHAAAAALLEQQSESERSRLWAVLAHHWGLAGNDRKAIEYLELAALQSRRDHALLEVTTFLREALERARRCPDAVAAARRAHWEQLLGEAEAALGQLTLAQQHLQSAIAYLARPLPAGRFRLGLELVRECVSHAWLRLGRRGRVPQDNERALAAARAYSVLATIHYNNHELGQTFHATLAGANLALRIGADSPTLARMLANLSIVAAAVPGVDADYYADRALDMAERLHDAVALQEVLFVVANYEMGEARFELATSHCERAIEIATHTGEIRTWEMTAGTLANLYRLRGHFSQAEPIDRAVLQSGIDRSVAQTQVWGFFGLACVFTHGNRLDELRELLVGFEELLAAPDVLAQVSASNVVTHLLTESLLCLHDGQDDRARAALARSVELLDSLEHLQAYMVCTISYLHAALMGCWRRRPDCPELKRWAKQADRFVERCARLFPLAKSQALLCRGNRALRLGRPAAAAQAFEAALLRARAIHNPFDEACAHDSLRRCPTLTDGQRASHAHAGRMRLDQLGIAPPFGWSV